MKKTDILTPVGLILGAGLILYSILAGGPLSIFLDVPSIFMTVGGSLSAILITYPLDEVKSLGKLLGQAFKESTVSKKDIISQFSNISKKARREGLLSLEEDISELEDEFLKKGLQMVIDGIEPETIKEILDLEIGQFESREMQAANIFNIWGSYAPSFGMLGTLVGLVQMLQNLTDMDSIAKGMGVALLTTFYGSLVANLFLTPIGTNLKQKCLKEVAVKEMMVEGILAIQSRVNPRIIEEKLLTYLDPKDRLEYLTSNAENAEGVME